MASKLALLSGTGILKLARSVLELATDFRGWPKHLVRIQFNLMQSKKFESFNFQDIDST